MNVNSKKLISFKYLYMSAKLCGSDKILLNYLNLPVNTILPLSLSHGIDMGHCFYAMDIYQPEPIHWAYNNEIFKNSKNIKKTILAPHPWAIILSEKKISNGFGTLIIGAPPGKINDTRLFERLKDEQISNYTILVKARGLNLAEESISFWKERGVDTITAGSQDDLFYYRLFDILNTYEEIIFTTFSSAVFFALSMGKKVKFLEGYHYLSFDTLSYKDLVNLNSVYTKKVIGKILKSSHEVRVDIAKEMLGFNFLNEKSFVKEKILFEIGNLKMPYYVRDKNKIKELFKVNLSLLFKKREVINNKISDIILSRFYKNNLIIKEVNEFSVWLDGPTIDNFKYLSLLNLSKNDKYDFKPGVGL